MAASTDEPIAFGQVWRRKKGQPLADLCVMTICQRHKGEGWITVDFNETDMTRSIYGLPWPGLHEESGILHDTWERVE